MHRGWAALLVAVFVVATYGIPAVSASTELSTLDLNTLSYGKTETVRMGKAHLEAQVAPEIRMLDMQGDNISLEFELGALESQSIEIEGETYHALTVEGGGFIGNEGEPMLPTFTRLIQIPDYAGVTVEYEILETQTFKGYRPLPVQSDDGEAMVINRYAYTPAGVDTPEPVIVGEPAIARDIRVVPVSFQPVTYHPETGSVEVATVINVTLRIDGVDQRNAKQRHSNIIPESFHRIYESMVANYSGPRDGQIISKGSYAIICPNNSTVVNYLQPMVEWHTRRGYNVVLATTAETGTSTSSIKNWIQDAYDTWDPPLEFVCLVGDHDGSIAIPTWFENYSYYGGEGDQPYTELDGSDVLCDVHLGRISVGSTGDVQEYVQKIINYEMTPYTGSTDWYKRGSVLGDPSYSGYTCIQIAQWLKTRFLAYGYTHVDTIFAGPWVTNFRNSLNAGVTGFMYRGYYQMSGIDEADILSLTNGRKLCYAVIMTCGTGSFASGTGSACRSEAFTRAGGGGGEHGGIGAIGTATTGTNTRYNNCATYGVWRSIFGDDNYSLGASITRAKYELYLNYWNWDSNNVRKFCHWNSLMGDPAIEMWTDVPQTLTVNYDATTALGSNSIPVEVLDGGSPVANAYVCLWKGSDVFTGGYTDGNGEIEIPIDASTAGEMLVTVTKHDYAPHLGSLDIGQQSRYVGYNSHTIDDDNSGGSSGNSDGVVNPGETIELPVQVKNFGSQSATGLTGVISSSDPYVTIIDASEAFPDISGGGTGWSTEDFDVEIDEGAPHGHTITLGLDVTGESTWHSIVELSVVAADLWANGYSHSGFGTRPDPGESGEISVSLYNEGGAAATGVTGTLTSNSQWVTVTDASGSWPNIGVGADETNSDPFGVSVSADCFQGHMAPVRVVLTFSDGARDTTDFQVQVGLLSSDDPTGPDSYGYYAFDNTDTSYEQAPTYSWVEIAPNYGGNGTSVGLTDFGNSQDDTKTVDLPFEFRYYGETFDRVSICSNGWITMGHTYLTNYRNWTIPCAGAPPNMIAPWWDNLCGSGSDTVYHLYDAVGHRYIITWSYMKLVLDGNPSSTRERFQVILYDPLYHETDTGDGKILFQYHTISNSDWEQQYSTTGIMNSTNTDGVLYGYYNSAAPGAASVSAGRAVLFMPMANLPRGTLTGTVYNESDGNAPLEGATVTIVETGEELQTGPDGTFGTLLAPGQYTLEVTHVSFAPETVFPVFIVEDQTTDREVYLEDIVAPIFSGTTEHPNTMDEDGPYSIFTTVTEYSTLTELSLHYNAHGAGWMTVPMANQGDDLYLAVIPGQAYTSFIQYYLTAEDVAGLSSSDPTDAPLRRYSFWVMPPAFEDDMEDGAGGWTHAEVTGGYVDQWHQSTARNHTLGGTTSWKFGDTGGGNYADYGDGALMTEAISVSGTTVVTFWHWMNAEDSSTYPGYAYDGGLIEISMNQGSWEQVTTENGYTHLIRASASPGSLPENTPVFSGDFEWTQDQIMLTDVDGSVRLRFRFASDGNTGLEGWYVDDVSFVSDSPSPSDGEPIELIPTRVALYQNTPNPFGAQNQNTTIRFDLPQLSPVRLQVFDTSGRLVRTLVDETLTPGQHRADWDGRDLGEFPVGSGVYFYKLKIDDKLYSKQLLILK